MRALRLCPKCRGKVVPNNGTTVGAWYCPRCKYRYSEREISEFVGNRPGGVTVIGT